MPLTHRYHQYCKARTAEIYSQDIELVRKYLTKPEQVLFYRMPVADQRHSLDVAGHLLAQLKKGQSTEKTNDIVTVALLHDTGKTAAPFSLPGRGLYVVLKKIFHPLPWLWTGLTGLGKHPKSNLWLRNLYVMQHHARIGAELLKEIATRPAVVKMVAKHGDPSAFPNSPEFLLFTDLDRVN